MIKKLRDILNTYTEEELEELSFWINSDVVVDQILIDEYSIDLITKDAKVNVEIKEKTNVSNSELLTSDKCKM